MNGAQLLVKCLESQGVKRIFGIPGAKIDAVFDALHDSKIDLVLCRHEQNAAFMAACHGRLTGNPGVVLVTSGPGVANLATGLLTATTEGDPIVAIGGNVPSCMKIKATHQNVENAKLLEPVTKSSIEVGRADAIPEAVVHAFRVATQPRRGASFISLPQDVTLELTSAEVIDYLPPVAKMVASGNDLKVCAKLINQAKFPVLLLGEESSIAANTLAVREFIAKTQMPTIGTYQASGCVSRDLVHCFAGRVGLFKNQPGDKLLQQADLVICVGYNPCEYDPEIWNAKNSLAILHIDEIHAELRQGYQPKLECLGDIAENIRALTNLIPKSEKLNQVIPFHKDLMATIDTGKNYQEKPIHPLRFIYELRQAITDDTLVTCDIGTVYMWMSRYFLCYEPRHLLFSNGQQTLGVALPWAMEAKMHYPDKQIISISGDGGFLFSAMELETAVRLGQHFVHFIWTDCSYNMVEEQEIMKYERATGVALGEISIPDFARSFGAIGYDLTDADDFAQLYAEANRQSVPVLINVKVDYRDNRHLFESFYEQTGN